MAGQFAISPEGALAYVSSPSVSLPTSDVVRVNRRGDVSALGAPPNTYRERVEVSPDGTTLAVTVQSTTDVRLFLYEMARGTLAPAFAQQAARDTIRPIWSAKGPIAMQVYRSGGSHLALLSADRTSVVEEPLLPQSGFAPSSWLRKGEALIGQRDGDLWMYRPSASGEKLERLTNSAAQERYPSGLPTARGSPMRPMFLGAMKCTSSDTQNRVHPFSCRPQAAVLPCGIPGEASCFTPSPPGAFNPTTRQEGSGSWQYRWPIPRVPAGPNGCSRRRMEFFHWTHVHPLPAIPSVRMENRSTRCSCARVTYLASPACG